MSAPSLSTGQRDTLLREIEREDPSEWAEVNFWGTRWLVLDFMMVRLGPAMRRRSAGTLDVPRRAFAVPFTAAPTAAPVGARHDKIGDREFDVRLVWAIEDLFPGCAWSLGKMPVVRKPRGGGLPADAMAYARVGGTIVALLCPFARRGVS